MRVAAKLAHDSRVWHGRQVRSHHRRSPAKVPKRRLGHQIVLQLHQRRHTAALGTLQQFKRLRRPQPGMELIVLLAANLFAPQLPEFASFLWTRPLHVPHNKLFAVFAQQLCSL